ncbi:MAG TPA: Hsp20/alpha crystallin family protein [Chitinophagaceae bacterium]|nr:Hsp20/alpha crystallin family protein [Chitinophagaceae bacterium]
MTQVKLSRRPFETSFNNLVDEFFSDMPVLFKNNNNTQANWRGLVPVNIKENEKSYSIDAVAPGFDKADFKINVEENILTIAAEKKNELKNDSDSNRNEKEIRKEYRYRSFQRAFTLDEKIDAAGIEARYVNGVLTLNLPKKEEVKTPSKQINIQ